MKLICPSGHEFTKGERGPGGTRAELGKACPALIGPKLSCGLGLKIHEVRDKEWWAGVLGEGIHTAFRKGTDHPESHKYWEMIRDMPDELWGDVLGYVVWSLGYMKLIEVEES